MILTLILTLWNSCLKIRVNSATVEVEVDFEAELGKNGVKKFFEAASVCLKTCFETALVYEAASSQFLMHLSLCGNLSNLPPGFGKYL